MHHTCFFLDKKIPPGWKELQTDLTLRKRWWVWGIIFHSWILSFAKFCQKLTIWDCWWPNFLCLNLVSKIQMIWPQNFVLSLSLSWAMTVKCIWVMTHLKWSMLLASDGFHSSSSTSFTIQLYKGLQYSKYHWTSLVSVPWRSNPGWYLAKTVYPDIFSFSFSCYVSGMR